MARYQRSYSDELRERARTLRHQGLTYSEILDELDEDVPKSTLQGWVRDIPLTTEQRERIKQKERNAAAEGRPKAAEWHREQRRERERAVLDTASPIVKRLVNDCEALILMASALYIGEGAKKDNELAFANSDPTVIVAWVEILRRCLEVETNRLMCRLYISEGMPDEELKQFWSELTGIPLVNFQNSGIKRKDQVGQIRREGYKGVCTVILYSTEARRFLKAVGRGVIAQLIEDNAEDNFFK